MTGKNQFNIKIFKAIVILPLECRNIYQHNIIIHERERLEKLKNGALYKSN